MSCRRFGRDLVAKGIVPDYALSSHVAPLGMVFNTGNGLPAQHNGGAFVGEPGSWDRGPLKIYRVLFVPLRNGRPAGKAQDVVTPFRVQTIRGRPVGLAMDRRAAC